MGKALKLFVDDLNMPQVDTYGTQQPVAWLKLFVERKGCFDRGKELNWKNVKDTQVLAAMGPPGGARAVVDPRFVSLFRVFNVPSPSKASMQTIFETMLTHHLSNFPAATADLCRDITTATIEIHEAVLATMHPTPSRFHYVFNLCDLSRIFEVTQPHHNRY